MKNIILAAFAALALAAAPARAGSQPQRALDECYGKPLAVHVTGWAFDPDVSSQSIGIQVYLYTDSDCTTLYDNPTLTANVPRPDVNQAKGITGDHGFDADIPVADAGDYWVKVFAIDATGDGNPQVGTTRSVTVAPRLPGSGTPADPYVISSAADWNIFASNIGAGFGSDSRYRLDADIGPVTNMVGVSGHPFAGTFDGSGHTLTVAINGAEANAAPFNLIDGATISNLVVTGTVAGGIHSAGLVGACGATAPNVIRDCTVAVTVNGSGYAGGIVGHGGSGTLTLDGCVFGGSVNGFNTCAGGLMGWCDALTLTITNCLSKGSFTPSGDGKYHPVACRFANRDVSATVAGAYYLNTIVPTVPGVNPALARTNLIPGAEGTPVSATPVAGEWAQPVAAPDGNTYYAWTTAPAGRLLAHYSFDDAGNAGTNLLRAAVGRDAIVRATPATPVAGIGDIAAVTDSAILAGLADGDGAVSIPNGQYLAIPIPAALLSATGRPYTVAMRIRVPGDAGWRCLLNMPASNDSDALAYVHRSDRKLAVKQFDKSDGGGVYSDSAVATNRWTTLVLAFGENAVDAYCDGASILHAEGALAGSYADCAASGGYILVGADDGYDDDLFHLSDFRIYEGAVARSVTAVTGGFLVELAPDSADMVLAEGDMLTGTGGTNTHVMIANGATVTLYDVAIDATDQSWAGITCLGSATIVLAGTNSVQGSRHYSGIYVPSGQTLVIRGDGSLSATGGDGGAGIGAGHDSTNSCGNIVIEGGTVTATGVNCGAGIGGSYYASCGNITIEGGTVTATGGDDGAGIGGGYHASCGNITIEGGTVTATGGDDAAGIGCGSSGSSCGDIAIASGVTRLEATAAGGYGADAIGEGWFGNCSVGTVAIGGTETGALRQRHVVYPVESGTYTIRFDKNNDAATGTMGDLEVLSNTPRQLPACGFTTDGTHVFRSWNTAADGSGVKFAEGGTILNYGDATFFAQWKATTFAIAYPGATDGENGVLNPNPASYTFDSGDITLADPVRVGYVFDGWTCEGQDTPTKPVVIPHGSSGDKTFTAHWSFDPVAVITTTTREAFLGDGHTLTGTGGQNTRVIIADGATVTLDGVDITAIPNSRKYSWPGITCEGDATIILRGGNAVNGGYQSAGIFVPEGKTLAIRGDGSLSATGNSYGAGIGGNYSTNCGHIVIAGGTVTATGGDRGAGIGSGRSGHCGDITISGGTITATVSGSYAAGIGTGLSASCGDIAIFGGIVTATGGLGGSGIGSCNNGSCGDIVISGGTVTATGGKYGAGIGSGSNGSCGDITIEGGTVTATGGQNGAGIGTGYSASCGNIVIAGGTITANGGSGKAAGIGCGNAITSGRSSCGDITIAGGVACVTATKQTSSASVNIIGTSGSYSTCGTVTIDPILKQVLSNDDKTLTLYPFLVLRDGADNAAAIAAAAGRTLPVQLAGRTFAKDGSWQTLCLPFDMTAGQVAAQLAPSALATLRSSSFADGTLALTFAAASAIEAGKPYIVRWSGGGNLVDPVFTNVAVRAAAAPVATQYADFVGSFSPVEIAVADADAFLVGTDGIPVQSAADTVLGACRAWFRLKGAAAGGGATHFEEEFLTAYDLWAAENGIVGPWNATDASGIHNVFRYAFDNPSGAFTNPPLLSISFDASGNPVVLTPPLDPSATGFDLSILAYDALTNAVPSATWPLSPDGTNAVPGAVLPARFFRLGAVEQ